MFLDELTFSLQVGNLLLVLDLVGLAGWQGVVTRNNKNPKKYRQIQRGTTPEQHRPR
jgi:hypothetical protein